MTLISGLLKTITGNVGGVVEVRVRAKTTRPSTDGLTLGDSEKCTYNPTTGQLSFTAEPGAAVLTIMKMGRAETIQILVPDQTTATLKDVATSATVYPPEVVASGVAQIRTTSSESITAIDQATANAVATIQAVVDAAIGAQLDSKADQTTVDQVQALVLAALGTASTALKASTT